MHNETELSQKYISKTFQLRPADIEHLQKISQGNMSFTIRKLIEDEWKAQSAKEQK